MKTSLIMALLLMSAIMSRVNAQSIADLVEQLELDKVKLTSMKATLLDMYQGYALLKDEYAAHFLIGACAGPEIKAFSFL